MPAHWPVGYNKAQFADNRVGWTTLKSSELLDNRPERGRFYSRRQLLKGAPLAVAGAIALGVFSRRLLSSASRWKHREAGLPKGSIFSPAKDSNDRA